MSHSSQRQRRAERLAVSPLADSRQPTADSRQPTATSNRYPSRFSITTCGPMPGTSNSSLTVVYRMRA